jgi:hypothetical protein
LDLLDGVTAPAGLGLWSEAVYRDPLDLQAGLRFESLIQHLSDPATECRAA